MIVNKTQLAQIIGRSEEWLTQAQKQSDFPVLQKGRGRAGSRYETADVIDWMNRKNIDNLLDEIATVLAPQAPFEVLLMNDASRDASQTLMQACRWYQVPVRRMHKGERRRFVHRLQIDAQRRPGLAGGGRPGRG